MKPVTPVIHGLDDEEAVYAKEQPEYMQLPCLRSKKEEEIPQGVILTRWSFTDEERKAIAAGADLFVRTMTFRQPLQPVGMFVAWDNEHLLAYFIENYR